MLRSAVVSVLATLALLAASAPAVAAEYEPFRIKSQETEVGSAGLVKGTITWDTARRGVVRGSVIDLCPADGRSVVVELGAFFSDSTRTERTLVHSAGCGKDARTAFRQVFRRDGANLVFVQLTVCLRDLSATYKPLTHCRRKSFDSPLS